MDSDQNIITISKRKKDDLNENEYFNKLHEIEDPYQNNIFYNK